MTDEDARAALDALIRTRREDYAGLSRLLGRNPAYIQQHVKRGSPRRLSTNDRQRLADYFAVDASMFGGPPSTAPRIAAADDATARNADLVAIPWLDVRASAGPGALGAGERAAAAMHFAPGALRDLGAGRPTALSLIRVEGESMLPRLAPGDAIMVDRDDAAGRLRDGIYVLRVGEALLVKRLAIQPGGRVAITSDNPRASPDWSDVDPASLVLIGRVIWAGGRIS
ncbi:S24 family peptidase [Sphingomonas nostoxanthinifaciens]|uniref:S24 family peptidase n=1 Tax=Sphingomonas nostoxanthinifaciens TaxID=2872652 RepID=UPI001CC1DF14|nr:S24 family peptidase [Sphingomonas nostoxanthinifaciens]UAK24630.1 S24 family peptidase [Sphingomonas nostoxanthinifaciens]